MREPVRLKTRLSAVMGQGSSSERLAGGESLEADDVSEGDGLAAPLSEGAPHQHGRRQGMTLWVSPAVYEAFRDAVYACPRHVTSADIAEEALQWAIEELRRRYNGGEPFPPRPHETRQLLRGRPVR